MSQSKNNTKGLGPRTSEQADLCINDPRYLEEELVKIEEGHRRASLDLEIDIDASPQVVYDWIFNTPHENFLLATDKIPGVKSTINLNNEFFRAPGSRRLVCITDKSIALEQILKNETNQGFSYVVWNYTSDVAQPIKYGRGQFWFEPKGDNSTKIRWQYAFHLKSDRFPGIIGPLGYKLFRLTFLNGPYKKFMTHSLETMKNLIEK